MHRKGVVDRVQICKRRKGKGGLQTNAPAANNERGGKTEVKIPTKKKKPGTEWQIDIKTAE